jgi:hypothetical protein
LVTFIGIFCSDIGENGGNTSGMEMINGTHKKSPSNSSKGNKRLCPKQKVAKKMQPHIWWTNVFVLEANLRKISYLHLQICGLD